MVIDQSSVMRASHAQPRKYSESEAEDLHGVHRPNLDNSVVPYRTEIIVRAAVGSFLEVIMKRRIEHTELGTELVEVLLEITDRVFPELADCEHLRFVSRCANVLDELRNEGSVDVL
jgi:hypothetical protein